MWLEGQGVELVEWSSGTVETIVIVLLVVCALGALLVLRTVQKVTTRIVLVLILVGVGVGLWFQREELQQCRVDCRCHLFGLDVEFPDLADRACR